MVILPAVFSLVTAAGILLASRSIVRLRRVPTAARYVIGALAVYGAAAFVMGAIQGVAYNDLFAGRALWQQLPVWLQGSVIGALVLLPIGCIVQAVRAVRREAGRWGWEQTIASAMTLVIVVTGMRTGAAGGWGVIRDGGSATPAAVSDALARSFRAIEEGEREAPRDRWDPAYVVEQVGTDPQALHDWVRDNTAWIPYRGLLRGAVGVLMDRQGNSLDRAVLLAILLRQAGHTVRLAHGEIASADVSALFERLVNLRTGVAGSTAARSVVPTIFQQLRARVRDQSDRLRVLVGGKVARGSSPSRVETGRAALQDHWWVQIQDGDQWRPLDPTADETGGRLNVSAEETLALDELPADVFHAITVRVVAEQWKDTALVERVVLEHRVRAADTIGVPIGLRLLPANWPESFDATENRVDGLKQAALQQHEWVPVLQVGSELVVQSGIRDTGEIDEKPQLDAVAKIGGSTAAGTQAAVDAFGAGETAIAEEGVLTAIWLEYQIDVPKDSPRTARRTVFDVLGDEKRTQRAVGKLVLDESQKLERSFGAMTETQLLPAVSAFATEFVEHLLASKLLAGRDLIQTVVNRRSDRHDDALTALADQLAQLPTTLYSFALARFDWSPFRDLVYIDRPNIFARHVFISPSSFSIREAIDIVANPVGVDFIVDDPRAVRFEQGVLDTNMEALIIKSPGAVTNAATAFDSAPGWISIGPLESSAVATLGLSEDVKRAIQKDLSSGYIAVAPLDAVPLEPEEFAGWWRIEPESGHVLGIGRNGWGVAFAERASLLTFTLMSTYLLCRTGLPNPQAGGYYIQPGGKGECLGWAVGMALFNAIAAFRMARSGGGPTGPEPSGPEPSPEPSGPKPVDPNAKPDPGVPPTQRSPQQPPAPDKPCNPPNPMRATGQRPQRPDPPYNNPEQWEQELAWREAEFDEAERQYGDAVKERLAKPIPRGPETPEESARLEALWDKVGETYQRYREAFRNLQHAKKVANKRPPGDTQPSGSPLRREDSPAAGGAGGCSPDIGFDKTVPQVPGPKTLEGLKGVSDSLQPMLEKP